MNSLSGYVKIHRKMLGWGWYHDSTVKSVFLHLLLTASFKPAEWNGRTIRSGQTVTSTQRLADVLGISRQQARTALDKLKATNEITIETTNKYSVITIVNWGGYQDLTGDDVCGATDKATDEQPANNQQSTNNQPTDNQQITNKQPHLKNVNNDKNVKNDNNKNTMCKAEALALFERLWQIYPNKKGKGQVSETQKKRLLSIGEPALVKAIERYSAELKKDADWRKPQNGSTFFNSGYVDYLDANYKGGYDPESLKDIGGEQYESMFDRRLREKKERGEINVDGPEPEYPF